jgi:hypothetical protein
VARLRGLDLSAPGPIESLLLGKALDATERLPLLIYDEHGDEANLPKDAFADWERDTAARSELTRLIDGHTAAAAAPRIVAPLIEPHLVHTPAGKRRALAESIARSERIGEGLLAAMSAPDRDGALTRALVQGRSRSPVRCRRQERGSSSPRQASRTGRPT